MLKERVLFVVSLLKFMQNLLDSPNFGLGGTLCIFIVIAVYRIELILKFFEFLLHIIIHQIKPKITLGVLPNVISVLVINK